MDLVLTEGPADRSSPKEHWLCPRGAIAPTPTVIVLARTPASRDPTDRRTGCFQKQSSPYIRIVQHAVLSVAGLKGIMNEFELTLMRQRSLAAIWQKTRRGEYQCRIPVGFCWTEDGRMELDPDRRVQQAVRHVFDKFAELGSVHQVFLSF